MDGTLLNANHLISDKNAASIKKLQSKGIEFMIATGRTFHSAKPFLDMHQIDCEMINLNGAAIYSKNGQLLKSIPMDNKLTHSMISYCQNNNIGYSIMDANYLFVQNRQAFIEHFSAFISHDKEASITDAQFINDIKYIRDISEYNFSKHNQVLKMMILSENTEILNKFHQTFDSNPSLDITSSGPDNLEVTHALAQKGLAIEDYVKDKGWTMNQVVTIGDSLNDRSMIEMAGFGYVMDNASDQVKELSNLRAPHHDKDGVSFVIEELIHKYSL